jgi:hypothetical protein
MPDKLEICQGCEMFWGYTPSGIRECMYFEKCRRAYTLGIQAQKLRENAALELMTRIPGSGMTEE